MRPNRNCRIQLVLITFSVLVFRIIPGLEATDHAKIFVLQAIGIYILTSANKPTVPLSLHNKHKSLQFQRPRFFSCGIPQSSFVGPSDRQSSAKRGTLKASLLFFQHHPNLAQCLSPRLTWPITRIHGVREGLGKIN